MTEHCAQGWDSEKQRRMVKSADSRRGRDVEDDDPANDNVARAREDRDE